MEENFSLREKEKKEEETGEDERKPTNKFLNS